MNRIGKLLGYIILTINAVSAVLLLVSAYSPYVSPQLFPVVSCLGLFFPFLLIANLLFLFFWLVVCRRYALLPLMVMMGCGGMIRTYFPVNGWGEDVPEDAIKVLSYNTRAFALKASHTREKSNEVLKYLQDSDADIICLQEYIWGGKLKKKDIDYALRDYSYKHYLSIGKGMNGLGCYSRYPILSANPIPYESNRNGSVAYRIKAGNDTLLVINNHLESNKILMSDVETYQDMVDAPDSQKLFAGTRKLMKKLAEATRIRAYQADAVVKTVKGAKEKHILVCGDFNDTPVSYTHRVLHEVLQDAFVESGNGLGISYYHNRLYFRIDHLLASKNLKVYRCTVDDTVKASDHYPVWCYISLK